MASNLVMDYVAVSGYSLLLLFCLIKLKDTVFNYFDLFGTVLLLTGLSSLIAYHALKIKKHKDETSDKTQKTLRLVAHSTITVFFLSTLSALSTAKWQFYDVFGVLGHSSLFALVLMGVSQVFGIAMLVLYFLFGSMQKIGESGIEVLQLVGRLIMLVFFIVALFSEIF